MEFFNNILCVSGTDLIKSASNPNGVLSMCYYTKLVAQNKINRVRRASKDTPALIEFDSLPVKYKAMVEAQYPDPRKEAINAPFAARIKPDAQARELFSTYTYDGGKSLPAEAVERYCSEAAIFNALCPIVEAMQTSRKAKGIRTSTTRLFDTEQKGVWEYALECIDSIRDRYPFSLPSSVRTLQRKIEKYRSGGYASLIHRGFGNLNRSAVKDPTAEALLLTLLRHGNQQSDVVVAEAFNRWAVEHHNPTLTPRAVTEYRAKNADRIVMQRAGKEVWNNRFDEVIRRGRPSAPLMLVNSDDNDLDLYFKRKQIVADKKTGKKRTVSTHFFRYKLYVVTDAHCDYILGYAVGEQISKELIREAYRNAMNHVRELTGSYHLWGQVVADRWGIGPKTDLRAFFENQAPFTPPPVGKARSKVIERSFGTEWHRELKRYTNYAGHNITAKTKHNSDFVEAHQKSYPRCGNEALAQIAEFIETMRTVEWHKTGRTRREVWLSNFTALNVGEARRISELTYLSTFGEKHGYLNRINNTGITITIDGMPRVYDIPDEVYRYAVGKRAQVQYDPADLTRILVSDGEHLRFVATENRPMPMALDDMTEGDRKRLNERLERKERRIIEVTDEAAYHQSQLARMGIDAQSLLQAGIKKKEARFEASAIASIPIPQTDEQLNIYQLIR